MRTHQRVQGRLCGYTIAVLLNSLVIAHAQKAAPWKDPSPHATRFVMVSKNVRLEVLDWGGSGRPVVLLAGGGDTAHVFDDFAPKLTNSFHVYGITRRGFGASGFSASESGPDRLGDDVLAVLDAFKLRRPVLVGHSIAGQEMSALANSHPNRVAGLVYLEAGYPYAFDNGKGPAFAEFQEFQRGGPQPLPPPPSEADRSSFAALRDYNLRVFGFSSPEAQLRQQRQETADGRVGRERDFPGYATLLTGMKKFAAIPMPALFVFAIPDRPGRWVENTVDPTLRESAKAFVDAISALKERQAKAIEVAVPTAHVVRLFANHYVYQSNEADVLREMRAFDRGLP